MYQLQTNEVNAISGGNFFGPMFNSITSGMTESEKAILITGLGVGLTVGGVVGRWAMIAGGLGAAGYIGWDWYASMSSSPSGEEQPS